MFTLNKSYFIRITNYIGYKIKKIDTEHKFINVQIEFLFNDNGKEESYLEEFDFTKEIGYLLYSKNLSSQTQFNEPGFITSITGNDKELLPDIIKNIKNKLNNN